MPNHQTKLVDRQVDSVPALKENLVLRSDISSGVVTKVIFFLIVLPLLKVGA